MSFAHDYEVLVAGKIITPKTAGTVINFLQLVFCLDSGPPSLIGLSKSGFKGGDYELVIMIGTHPRSLVKPHFAAELGAGTRGLGEGCGVEEFTFHVFYSSD
jgi:hypothetical protein